MCKIIKIEQSSKLPLVNKKNRKTMKHQIYTVLISIVLSTFVTINTDAQTNKTIDENSSDLAKKIIQSLKSKGKTFRLTKEDNAKVKIAVLNFFYINNKLDTVRSELGHEYSKRLMFNLQSEIQKKNNSFEVLIPNKAAQEKMDDFFVLPEGVNESEYWKNYLGKITPDFYITGEVKIDNNYDNLTVTNVFINSSNYANTNLKIAIPDIKTKINFQADKINFLEFNAVQSISQLSDYIALQLKFKNNIENVELLNFTYESTGIASDFSYRLTSDLEMKLVNKANYKVTKNRSRGRTDKTLFSLSGSYIADSENLKIYAKLVNSATGQTVSGVEAYLPLSYLKNNNILYKPDNFEKIIERKEKVEEEKKPNDFDVEIWTNKGNTNLVFAKDDILQLYIKSERECYVRLIYILADGTPVLLLDNYKVNAGMVGKEIKIPQRFVCAEPFGAETLLLNAQTIEKYDALKTHTQYGYEFIDNNLQDILENNRRGFTKEINLSETSLNFVTIDKK